MNLVILGCGYVANMYRLTLKQYPKLKLIGVFDIETSRSKYFAEATNSHCYSSFDELLSDNRVELVLNFTNPLEHYSTSLACLKAKKHVYSEKPLAMDLEHAKELVSIAKEQNLMLCSAPCTLMNGVSQSLWNAINKDLIGKVRLVYAEMEDGMVAKAPVKTWINELGTPWPYINEFETGCTVEHAGYVLTWLLAYFGPAESVTAFTDTLNTNEIYGERFNSVPDFSVACIKFQNGVVARMTNGIYAEHDHKMSLFGDDGVIRVEDPRSDDSKAFYQTYKTLRRKRFLNPFKKRLPIKIPPTEKEVVKYKGSQTRDFCRVIADMAESFKQNRSPYISAEFSLHVTELTLACQFAQELADKGSMPYRMTTTFEPLEQLPWAK